MESKLAIPAARSRLRLMKEVRIINLDDPVGKTVGRRRPPNPLCAKAFTVQRSKEWQEALPVRFPPKGVFRFKTHEEADLWMRENTRVRTS
ncbi:MAG: hypothetical protein O3A87_06195 [Verrucomicrobia bacterium]|nr:hypothetical protein [Verrucomicrobiota bacterium]MDA1006056.1 hypothetical protein [Verrucomicrobiota bacterium]